MQWMTGVIQRLFRMRVSVQIVDTQNFIMVDNQEFLPCAQTYHIRSQV